MLLRKIIKENPVLYENIMNKKNIAIKKFILRLLERKKSLLMRKNIENNWSWKLRSKEWINFFLANIDS